MLPVKVARQSDVAGEIEGKRQEEIESRERKEKRVDDSSECTHDE